jgi:hypothetical protein
MIPARIFRLMFFPPQQHITGAVMAVVLRLVAVLQPAAGHRESRRITAPQTEIVAVPSGVVIKIRAAEAAKSWTHMKHPPTATASGAVARPMPVEPDGPEVWPRPMQHSNPPPASNKSITINDLMAASPRKTGDWNNPGHL